MEMLGMTVNVINVDEDRCLEDEEILDKFAEVSGNRSIEIDNFTEVMKEMEGEI